MHRRDELFMGKCKKIRKTRGLRRNLMIFGEYFLYGGYTIWF